MKSNESISRSSEEFEAMFFKYRPIVEIMYKKYYLKDYDLDDWMQEGRIVFNKCLQAYDEKRGTTLGVLFKRSFENRVCSLLRLQQAQKRKAQLNSSSLEEKISHEGPNFLSDQNEQTEKAEKYLMLQETMNKYDSPFSKLEQIVIMNYLKGLELEQIAEQTELPLQQIKSAYNRGKKKLRALLMNP